MWGGLIGGLAGGAFSGESGGAAAVDGDGAGAAGRAPEGEPSAGKQEKSSSCKVHSFVSSTGVLMADSSSKQISQVKAGDRVANSVPGDARLQTHTVQKVIVTQTDRDFVDLTVKTLASKVGKAVAGFALAAAAIVGTATPASADTSTLTATYHHPFYDVTQAAFVDAVDLHPGDQLQTVDGGSAEVAAVRAYHQTEITYDLTIDGLHTYYVLAGATPVLVHNCDEGYADVYLDDAGGHASIAVTHGGETLHTEAGSEVGQDSVGGFRTTDHNPGTTVIRIPLSNARNAQNAQRAYDDYNFGPHNRNSNNCVTYCKIILEAGGYEMPVNDSQNISSWLHNTLFPRRRL
jgi:hypothetical protein